MQSMCNFNWFAFDEKKMQIGTMLITQSMLLCKLNVITLHIFPLARHITKSRINEKIKLHTFITQIGIVPSTKEILLIPFGFTMTNHNNLIFSSHSDDSLYFYGFLFKNFENQWKIAERNAQNTNTCVYGFTVTDRINVFNWPSYRLGSYLSVCERRWKKSQHLMCEVVANQKSHICSMTFECRIPIGKMTYSSTLWISNWNTQAAPLPVEFWIINRFFWELPNWMLRSDFDYEDYKIVAFWIRFKMPIRKYMHEIGGGPKVKKR